MFLPLLLGRRLSFSANGMAYCGFLANVHFYSEEGPHLFLDLCVSCHERALTLSDAFIVSIKVIM